MHDRTKAGIFTNKARKAIYMRDLAMNAPHVCYFCKIGYKMDKADVYSTSIYETMHIIPKSQGGLGIEKNGIIGCKYHHMMFDNGNNGSRAEMRKLIEQYMKDIYRNWNTEELTYSKW